MRTQIQRDKKNNINNLSFYKNSDKLSREKTLDIFYAQQKMEREAYKRVSRVQEKEVKEEWLV